MIRLTITDQPAPAVTLTGPDGQVVDVTQQLDRLVVELDPAAGGPWVTLTLRADVAWAFPVDRVAVTGGDPLEGITEAELDEVLAAGGMRSSPAVRILAHLRARLS